MILISIYYNNWFSYLCALYNNDFYFIYYIQLQRRLVVAVFESWDPKCDALVGFRITWYSITSFPVLAERKSKVRILEPCSISVWKSATFSDCNESRGPNFGAIGSEQINKINNQPINLFSRHLRDAYSNWVPYDCTKEWEDWIKKTQGEIDSQNTTGNKNTYDKDEIDK